MLVVPYQVLCLNRSGGTSTGFSLVLPRTRFLSVGVGGSYRLGRCSVWHPSHRSGEPTRLNRNGKEHKTPRLRTVRLNDVSSHQSLGSSDRSRGSLV